MRDLGPEIAKGMTKSIRRDLVIVSSSEEPEKVSSLSQGTHDKIGTGFDPPSC
jgi:hypothetical protein